jgi:uncharacterized protein (DUF1330 family)
MMKTHYTLTLAMLAGIAIGAAAVQSLHAQAKPPAIVVSLLEITDEAAYTAYAAKIPPIIAQFGGKYLARGGKTVSFEGDSAPQRVVLTQFESMEKAQAWRNAPAYQELRPEGRKSSKLRQFVVEGIAN